MRALIAAASAAALLSALPAIAQAQDAAPARFYGDLGYANLHDNDVNLGAIQGRLGVRLGQHFGVEGELAGGVKGDSVNVGGTNVKVDLQHQAAIYGVGFLPLTPNVDLLARVGYGTTKIKGSALGQSASDDGESWNFGMGGQYRFDDANGVRLDYTRQEFRGSGSGSADVWSLGYVRQF